MSKLQIGVLGAVLAGGVAAPLFIEHRAQAELRAAREAFNAQSQELAARTAENEHLSNLLAELKRAQQQASSQEFSASQEAELLRLRGEVGRLRRETNELARLQANNQRLRGAGKTGASLGTAQDPAAHEYIQKEAWAFRGFADPESALQSTVWAMNNGDAKAFLAALSPEGEDFKKAQTQSESEMVAEAQKEVGKVTAYKILDKEAVSDNEVILTVYAQGVDATARFRMNRLGDGWKFGGVQKEK